MSDNGCFKRIERYAPWLTNLTRTPCEQTMNASRPLPGTSMRRMRISLDAQRAALEPRSAKRLNAALLFLGAAYALSWLEVPFEFAWLPPHDASQAGSPSAFAAAIMARVLLGALYAFVALGRRWARWVTIALSVAGVVFVVPALPAEWAMSAPAALVTGAGALCKAAAALLLALPRRGARLDRGAAAVTDRATAQR